MKTHISRGRAGFSMVELLVTVLIAGIAFAAMVPLFVQAQQKNVDDNMRVMTLQLARDRIEKIRQLDYDSITQANLDDETFADAQFGNTYVLKSGTGSTRNVSVTYTVTNQPAGAPDGTESYKKVEVSVSWTAPPSPVYPAVLSTVVYKQYAGPQIIEFDIDPNVLEEVTPDVWNITGTPDGHRRVHRARRHRPHDPGGRDGPDQVGLRPLLRDLTERHADRRRGRPRARHRRARPLHVDVGQQRRRRRHLRDPGGRLLERQAAGQLGVASRSW